VVGAFPRPFLVPKFFARLAGLHLNRCWRSVGRFPRFLAHPPLSNGFHTMLDRLRVSSQRFQVTAWGVLGYNVLVILWGAVVRATGSGAGCGDHWPLCNGEVVPRAASIATLVEFAHRATSGIALIAVVILALLAFASYEKGNVVRKLATISVVFVTLEAIIGAGLVLFQLVAQDKSVVRGISMALHLVNTFLLLGALTLTAWCARRPFPSLTARPILLALTSIGFILLGFVGMTGAIAALGDTLFPVQPYRVGEQPEVVVEEIKHLFLRLRIWHPVVAIISAVFWGALSAVASMRSESDNVRTASLVVFVATVVQVGIGVLNVALRAPVWLQIIHLGIADVIFVAAVVFSAELLRAGFAPVRASHAITG